MTTLSEEEARDIVKGDIVKDMLPTILKSLGKTTLDRHNFR